MRWVVSVKGVVRDGSRVLLAKNDRGEWELPGGQLEDGEQPDRCVVREVAEESGLTVEATGLVDTYSFEVVPGTTVLIITFRCRITGDPAAIRVSSEHREVRFVELAELDQLSLPEGYRSSIERDAARGN
ncbi:MAG: NUDIX domain-containing protein [Propionibacteriales bacterium]|nr:NUDIX domain-containing protein [Propionibacteriales bacterium]